MLCSEASCHLGTWGTCPLPPDGVATLVNSLQNQVNSITLCVTLNANIGKIVLVTLCIRIAWLFYNAFWCETVTRKWHWLHPKHGCTKSNSKKNKKTRKWSNRCTDHTEALTKTTDCTSKAKKVKGTTNNFLALRGSTFKFVPATLNRPASSSSSSS